MTRLRRGFTLIELLVVMTIIAILMGLISHAVITARRTAHRTACANNLRQIGIAIGDYSLSQTGKLPGYLNKMGGIDSAGTQHSTVVGWAPLLVGRLGRHDIHTLYDNNLNSNAIPSTVASVTLDMLVCPSDTNHPLGADNHSKVGLSYLPNGGIDDATGNERTCNGVFFDQTVSAPLSITIDQIARKDGVTNTLMFSENVQAERWNNAFVSPSIGPKEKQVEMCLLWDPTTYSGVGINKDLYAANFAGNELKYARPSSFHPGGVNALYCDGSVRFLSENIEPIVYALIMTPDGARAGQTRMLNDSDFER